MEEELTTTAHRQVKRAEALMAQSEAYFNDGNFDKAYTLYSNALKCAPALVQLRAIVPSISSTRMALFFKRAGVSFQLGWLVACITDCSLSLAENSVIVQDVNGKEQKSFQDCELYTGVLRQRAAAWQALGFTKRACADLLEVLPHCSETCKVDVQVALQQLKEKCENHVKARVSWEEFPDEPQTCIASFLSIVTLARLQEVSHECRTLGSQRILWKNLLPTVLGSLHEFRGISSFECCIANNVDVRSHTWGFNFDTEISHASLALQQLKKGSNVQKHAPSLWVPRLLSSLGTFPPIVVDIGMGYTKAGLAGASQPMLIIPNMAIVGHEPVVNLGLFTEKEDLLTHFLQQAVFHPLKVDPRCHAVVLCLSTYQSDSFPAEVYEERVKMAESCLRERLGVPLVCSIHSAVLTLLCHDLHSGVVVDIGLGVARATAVIHGEVCRNGSCLEYFGAANCTNYLLQTLKNMGEAIDFRLPEGISGFQVMMLVKATKEELGFVVNTEAELGQISARPAVTLSEALQYPVNLGRELAIMGEMFFNPKYTGSQHSYFGPESPEPRCGLHKLVQDAVAACPESSWNDLMSGVVLAGGTSSMPGMGSRLQAELVKLVQQTDEQYDGDGKQLIGFVPHVLEFHAESAWCGGSLVGSMLTGQSCYVEASSNWDYTSRH